VTFGKFFGIIAAMLLAAVLLVWIFVSLAALVYALTQGDSQAAGNYALFVAIGLVVAALAWWLGARVVKARAARQ